MASTINALSTGSGGLITTGDASGQLELQANGSTKLTVSSSGVNIAGGIASPLIVTGNSTAGAELRLPEDTDNGSNYVALKAADSLASNLTFTLPSADGTSGQVLQTNGSGTLSFATPSSGAVVWLATATASSSASLTFDSTHITSTYDTYMLVLTNILLTNNDFNLYVNWSSNNGSSYISAYRYANWWVTSGNATGYTNQNSLDTSIVLGRIAGGNAGRRFNYTMYLVNPQSPDFSPILYWNGGSYGDSSSSLYNVTGIAAGTTTYTVNNLQFISSSGNITSGSIKLYGIKNS